MKKLVVIVVMFSVATATFAKNIVPVHTSCGKTAYIDTDRGSAEDAIKQAEEIDRVLCGD